jgi:hypothetical protein
MELHDTILAAVAASHRDDLVHDADAYRAGRAATRGSRSAPALVRAVRRLANGTRQARPHRRSGPAGTPRAA